MGTCTSCTEVIISSSKKGQISMDKNTQKKSSSQADKKENTNESSSLSQKNKQFYAGRHEDIPSTSNPNPQKQKQKYNQIDKNQVFISLAIDIEKYNHLMNSLQNSSSALTYMNYASLQKRNNCNNYYPANSRNLQSRIQHRNQTDGKRIKIDQQNYIQNKPLYIGNYASIYQGERLNKQGQIRLIMKVFHQQYAKKGQKERQIWEQTCHQAHPRIVPLLECKFYYGNMIFIMNKYQNDLSQVMNSFYRNQKGVMKLIKQTTQGLNFLHSACGIIHLDLKEAQIMVERIQNEANPKQYDFNIKIGDFGHSCVLGWLRETAQKEENISLIGTPLYMAPETFARSSELARLISENSSQDNKQLYKIDIWSLGVILFSMLTRRKPIELEYNIENLMEQYKQNEHRYKEILISQPSQLYQYVREYLGFHWMFILWTTLSFNPRARIDSTNLFHILSILEPDLIEECRESDYQLKQLQTYSQNGDKIRYEQQFRTMQFRRIELNLRNWLAPKEEIILQEIKQTVNKINEIDEFNDQLKCTLKLGWIAIIQELEKLIQLKLKQKILQILPDFSSQILRIQQFIENQNIDYDEVTSIFQKTCSYKQKEVKKRSLKLIMGWFNCISEAVCCRSKLTRQRQRLENILSQNVRGNDGNWWLNYFMNLIEQHSQQRIPQVVSLQLLLHLKDIQRSTFDLAFIIP